MTTVGSSLLTMLLNLIVDQLTFRHICVCDMDMQLNVHARVNT